MGHGWLSSFEFTADQRRELLALLGATEEEAAGFLDSMQFAIRNCQAEMSEELSPLETERRLKQMRALAQKLSQIWPHNSDFDILLGHGFRGACVPIRFRVSDTMIPIVDDIAIACKRALAELEELNGKPRRGRQHNAEVAGLAYRLSLSWKDGWGERAPRGKMLKVMEYLLSVAEKKGDARRALEIVLPDAPKQRGRVRRRGRPKSRRP